MLMQPDDPLLGRILNGRYEIIEPLGAGGMGRIYRAIQHPLDRLVALKVLDPRYDRTNDPEFEKRFLLEASVTAKLKHPNTVTVHDYGRTDDGVYYIAMELLEGETLQQVLLKSGTVPWTRALYVAGQVARSLREAHRLGLVHRDLKPANIMLISEGAEADAVKVLDFGLVKDFTAGSGPSEKRPDLTQASMLIGSPLYVSPEQIRNKIDPRSDIYSLGVVLFQAISGRTPFVGNDTFDIIAKHLRERPPELRQFATVPVEVNHLVMKCLEKAPEARFQNMDELLEAMRQATSGQGISGIFRDRNQIAGLSPTHFPGTTALTPTTAPPAPEVLRRSGPPTPTLAPSSPDAARRVIVPTPALVPPAATTAAATPSAGVEASRALPIRRPRALVLIAGAGLAAGVLFAVALLTCGESEPARESGRTRATVAEKPSRTNEANPSKVLFEITSEPSGAAVLLGGRAIGITPHTLSLPRESDERSEPLRVELGFFLEGYLSATRVAEGLEGAPVRVHQVLVRRPPAAPIAAPGAGPAPGTAPPPKPPSRPPKKPLPAGYKDDPY